LLKPQTPEAVRGSATTTTSWTTAEHGLFTNTPHIMLHERSWDEASRTTTERWFVIDSETAAVERHAMSSCSYDRDELANILQSIGFDHVVTHRSLTGEEDGATPGLFALEASRGGTV
jgi:DNA phosphorothioation-dependent restriction protein DptG